MRKNRSARLHTTADGSTAVTYSVIEYSYRYYHSPEMSNNERSDAK